MSCENAKIALLLGKFADDLFLGSTEIYLGQYLCEPHIDKALTCGDLEFFSEHTSVDIQLSIY